MFNFLIKFITKYTAKTNITSFKTVLFFLALLWFSASGYLFFEMQSKPDLKWSDGLWWAVVTMTTVGYGDFFPESAGGRYFIGIPTMILGIGMLGFILSEVASKLIESKSRRSRGMTELKLSNHVIIINFNNLEKIIKLIDELKFDPSSKYKQICLIDETLDELPFELEKMDVFFIKGNPTKESVLKRACLSTASHAIVLSKDPANLHSDDQNLATILIVGNLSPSVITVVECLDNDKIKQFKAAGCNSVVCIAPLTTNLLVQEMQDPGVQTIITEITSNIYGQQLYLVDIEKMKKWQAAELVEWSTNKGCVVIGIKRGGQTFLNCKKDFGIQKGDKAIILGSSRLAGIEI